MYRMWYTVSVGKKPKSSTSIGTQPEALENQGKRIPAVFYRTEGGGEPVRDWLKGLPSSQDRKRIGEDIKTVEFGWPIGMPVCKPLGEGIYGVAATEFVPATHRTRFFGNTHKAGSCCCTDSSRKREDTGRGFGPGASQTTGPP